MIWALSHQTLSLGDMAGVVVENILWGGNDLRLGFTQRSGTAEVETQCLYYAEMKIIIDSVDSKEGKT